ncbi:high mobility group nucleosome-binding domain-containing protein 5-like [Musca domestica]|uniref:High mobility group nucleosome-binding domain-containing protein 5-like n=1 Tax=Musca domestica TaxID=7370 RepID=A0ABM3VR60_MUSDO|nr:high mobility group nucleosome-binding domain-containing protein 5-like [Musca domestica]
MEKEFQNQKFQEEERENTTASGVIELENPGALNTSEFDMEKMVREFRAFQNVIIQQHQEKIKSIMEEIEQMFLSQQSSNNQKGDKEEKERQVVEAGKDDLSTQLANAREGHNAVERKQIPVLEEEEENSALTNEEPEKHNDIGEKEKEMKAISTEGPIISNEYGKELIEEVGKDKQSSLVPVPEEYSNEYGNEFIEEVGKAKQNSLVPVPEGLSEIHSKSSRAVKTEDDESELTIKPTAIFCYMGDDGLQRWTTNSAAWKMKPANKGGGIGKRGWIKRWSRFLEAVT